MLFSEDDEDDVGIGGERDADGGAEREEEEEKAADEADGHLGTQQSFNSAAISCHVAYSRTGYCGNNGTENNGIFIT